VNAKRAAAVAGLYAITPDTADTAALIAQVRAAIEGGARCVQYRNKTADAERALEQARALKALCGELGATFIVNDRIDVAAAVGADGVHLGRGDGSVSAARAACPRRVIVGVSCYDDFERARAAAAEGADYIAFGSFFPSTVKPGAVRATPDLLRRARREIALPLVAIGGITVENAPPLIEAGAHAIAVISALFAAPDVRHAAQQLSALFESRS
jgi:thiamine-phosphate pyrophosphorylase